MRLSRAQVSVLADVARTQEVRRVWPRKYGHSWTWHVAGKPRSGPVDDLLRVGCLTYANNDDKDVLVLSPFGQQIVKERGLA